MTRKGPAIGGFIPDDVSDDEWTEAVLTAYYEGQFEHLTQKAAASHVTGIGNALRFVKRKRVHAGKAAQKSQSHDKPTKDEVQTVVNKTVAEFCDFVGQNLKKAKVVKLMELALAPDDSERGQTLRDWLRFDYEAAFGERWGSKNVTVDRYVGRALKSLK